MTFVGVCGGRDFADHEFLDGVLSERTKEGDAIVHGGANGADAMAGEFARSSGRFEIIVPAMWFWMGKGAGPRRNEVIASLPLDLLIVFPGGKGTADMAERARAHGIVVLYARPG